MADTPSKTKIHTILVACGTAIATSTHVTMKITEELEKRGKQIHVIQCRVQEIPRYADSAALIIATAHVPFDVSIPVFNGVPFLTGIGLKEVIDEIDRALV